MYCLRLFIVYKNYIVYYNVYCYYCGVFIEKHTHTKLIGCCVSELHGHICSYRNVWPEAVYLKNYIVYQIVYMFL